MINYAYAENLDNKSSIKVGGSKNVPRGHGICTDCTHFAWETPQYGEPMTTCTRYEPERPLNKVNPIVECSRFYPRGQLSMLDMVQMATIIDVKRKIGFANEVIVEIRPPKEQIEEENTF